MGLFDLYFITAAVFCSIYLILISAYTIKWLKMPVFIPSGEPPLTKVTIIIPARNEEKNIQNCIADISTQEFPMENLEVIVVDDYSEDNTATLAKSTLAGSSLNGRVLKMAETNHALSFKKGAITEAIKIASHELIVTTDADCRMGNKWLSTIVSYYDVYHPKMIAGPTSYLQGNGLLTKLQNLEFAGLMLATGGGFKGQFPIMANGANLCYEKQAFEKVSGYTKSANTPSGDDLFLLMKFKDQYPDNLHFLKSPEAIVYTQPMRTLRSIWMQRKRWASKSRQCRDLHFMTIGAIVVGTNFVFNGVLILRMVLLYKMNNFLIYSLLIIKINYL